MNLHSAIIDDFHPEFDPLRSLADRSKFEDLTNPADGVVYPGICQTDHLGVPGMLSAFLRRPVQVHYQFMRLSLEGSRPPHWAHHDGLMGKYSLMLYLNRPEHCKGGTALLEHADGEIDQATWKRDTNRSEMWRMMAICEMRPNRAFIFRSHLWHAALPMSGFGKDATDGRLVLTAFFS